MMRQVNTSGWRTRLLESTRGRILDLLRGGEKTVNELAAALNLTDNAVRAHLATLERDGLARQVGTVQGFRKPHATYGLTAEAEQIFPKAYGPLLDLFLTVISKKVDARAFRAAMREVGKKVADNHLAEVAGKTRAQRVEAALRILKDLGGAATFQESEGKHWIRGNGCPLAAATGRHPEACLIAESLLSEIIGVPVKQRCTYDPAPSCCFEVQ
ncbi:MAG TPA: ArsR family transcriptional regulator [Chthoniobacterales bacterium]|nr:ArsR family transcriptional regulator [Chthoniobacterales bacterium]